MIVVTVAGGNIGTPLIRGLVASGAAVRVISRDPSKAGPHLAGAEVVAGDLNDPASIEPAFRGADVGFLMAPSGDRPDQDRGIIEAATRAGLPRAVMLSSLGVEFGGVGSGAAHGPAEDLLRTSGMAWTILHPAEFMTNTRWWRSTIATAGSIFVPSGTGTVAMIDPADIGAVAAHVLTTDGHADRTYRLTGPQALTTADIAAALTEVLGRPVRHVDVPDDGFKSGLERAGFPPQLVDLQVRYYAAMKAGRVGLVSTDVADLIGRPPRSYLDWARENAEAFR